MKSQEQIRNFFIEALFPSACYLCSANGSYLCESCFDKIGTLPHPICPHCSIALSGGQLPPTCRNELLLDRLYTIADYKNETINKLIKDMKYRYAYKLADSLGDVAHFWLRSRNYTKDFPISNMVVLAVPSHIRKQRARGFNPAERIAARLAGNLSITHKNNILIKAKATPSQVEVKDRALRAENIKGSFTIQKNLAIKGKTILLIDDVVTTGSTLRECAKVLGQSGAHEVWGLAIAKD